jgi:hypothetical protein
MVRLADKESKKEREKQDNGNPSVQADLARKALYVGFDLRRGHQEDARALSGHRPAPSRRP